ncbi:type I secretion system permease/ATPase [Amaricoccus macauensis]|uniref:type I secretion system permease/ATPase n=1 Tax=Amaricoccus macauensis TaxID=57001 RepID=UPI003C7C1947
MKNKLNSAASGLHGMTGLFVAIAVFSAFVNLLMLTGPLYMLQIYDRVLTSKSVETLVALTMLIGALFAFMGVLDFARARIAARIGAKLQSRLDGRVFNAILRRSVHSGERSKPATGLKDLESVQRLLSSPILFAVFDMPWAPLFIAAIYTFHPWLGHLAVCGTLIIVCITLLNQYLAKKPEQESMMASNQGDVFAESIRQQGEMVRALGMSAAVTNRWQELRRRALSAQLSSSDRVGQFTTMTKSFRFFLQSAILGLAAYLVIQGDLSPGAMIAGSILLGRALAPIEQAIGGWPNVIRARQGWTRLNELLASTPEAEEHTALPRPRAELDVNQITVFPPEQQKASLRMMSFHMRPGQALGVIGASASGKSTLARVLAGIWRPSSGSVRLDGAALDQYEPDVLGSYIGYLPQDVVLFNGTVADNIARMQANPDPAQIVDAAKKAGAHEMILQLPNGYDTPVSSGGGRLSGGQKQRIGLARAFYGDPVFLVLDEPNSNLDSYGQDALNSAIRQAKEAGKIVIIMAHRPAGIAECDLILIVEAGAAKAFGPRDEVLKAHVKNYAQVAGQLPAQVSAEAR